MAVAASTILSIPGWEQPTTRTMPSGVSMARDSSRSSSVVGLSETVAMRRMPGAISVVFSINSKFAFGQALPNFNICGGAPS